MTYFDGIKKGDKVWDFVYKWGSVENIENDIIEVLFESKLIGYYDFDGVIIDNENNLNQSLFWDEIKFRRPKNPTKLPKPETPKDNYGCHSINIEELKFFDENYMSYDIKFN